MKVVGFHVKDTLGKKRGVCFQCGSGYERQTILLVVGDNMRDTSREVEARFDDVEFALLINRSFLDLVGNADGKPVFLNSIGAFFRPRERYQGFCQQKCLADFDATARCP